jgi:tetratricopeptide (TPR) repeat protein
MTTLPSEKKPSLWLWLLPLLLALLAFGTMFRNGFVWDDAFYLVKNQSLRALWPPAWLWGSPGPGFPWLGRRPVTALSFALDYALWKGNLAGFHLTNLLLHLTCTLGVMFLARTLFRDRVAVLAAGVLFAVHPGHGEAVVAFLGRSDLLAAAFVLLGFWGYLRSRDAVGLERIGTYVLSLLSFLLACLAKETGLVLMGLLGLYEAFVAAETKSEIRNLKAKPIKLLPFLLLAVLYLAWRSNPASGTPALPPSWAGNPASLGGTLFGAFADYLRLFLFPLHLSPWYEAAAQGAGFGIKALLGITAFLLSLGIFLFLWKRDSRSAFPVGWFLLGLSPVLLGWLLPMLGLKGLGGLPGPVVAERWLYLPSVGGCLALGWAYSLLREKVKPAGRALVSLGGMALVALLVWRQVSWNPVWRSEENIARAIVAAAPQSALGYNHLGFALWQQGRLGEAEQEIRRAIRLNPGYAEAHNNLAYALWQQDKAGEAEKELREAVRLKPDYADAHIQLGNILLAQRRPAEAEEAYRGAVRSRPDYPEAYFNLGVALAVQGKPAEAEAQYRQAVRLNPDYAEAHNNLGEVLGGRGRHGEAEREFREALRTDPNHAGAVWNLAACLDYQGRRPEARPYWQMALKLERDPRAVGAIQQRLKQPD